MERIERFTEVPMLVLAIAYVPAFIVEYLPDVPPEIRQDADIVQWTIVAAFAVELLVKVAVADRRLSYLRSHWPEVLIVVLPFLRPLRVLLVLPFLIRAVRGLERILGPYKAAYVLVLWLLTVFTGAGLVLLFEEGSGGTINGFWDALWWAVTTITTVGYGDTYPVTFAGRVVAIVVMLVGIILFGVLTAGVAAYFVERVEERDEGEQTHKLDLVLKRLDEQEERNKKVDLSSKGWRRSRSVSRGAMGVPAGTETEEVGDEVYRRCGVPHRGEDSSVELLEGSNRPLANRKIRDCLEDRPRGWCRPRRSGGRRSPACR